MSNKDFNALKNSIQNSYIKSQLIHLKDALDAKIDALVDLHLNLIVKYAPYFKNTPDYKLVDTFLNKTLPAYYSAKN